MIKVASTQQLGAFIKKVRKDANIRLVDAAMMSGVSHPVLSKIERGLEKGDADAFTSLFSLLPQMGIRTYLGKSGNDPIQIKTKQDFAVEIIKQRKQQHLSQADAAGLIEISTPTLSKIESPAKKPDKKSDVRLKILFKVLRGFGLNLYLYMPE